MSPWMWTQGVTVVVLVLLLIHHGHAGVAAQNMDFSFSRFALDDGRVLKLGDASFTESVDSYDMNHRAFNYGLDASQPCARILYKDSVWMRTNDSGRIASFNTSFTFAFLSARNSSLCRAGMAFTFAWDHSNLSVTEMTNRSGGGMCTFDYADKSAANRVFAVKFDSSLDELPEYPDPSDSNVGVIISSRGITRVSQYNLCGSNATSCNFFCRDKGSNFTAWIDYDSARQSVEVRLRNSSLAKPADPLIRVFNVSLDESVLESEFMYAGFSSSAVGQSGELSDVHRIGAWNFSSSGMSYPSTRTPVGRIIGGVCAAVLGTVLTGVLLFVALKRRERRSVEKLEQSALGLTENCPRAFTYRELSRITKDFNDSELLSAGAYGDVYRGTLPSGAIVAVKLMKHDEEEEGEESFLAEVTSLRQIRHRNLLQLRGWCHSRDGLLLVYDYMCNGSLDKWLFHDPKRHNVEVLSWNVRCAILAGVASGLKYLHEEWVQCVLHRDIKSSNVLLDKDFNPYLGDFGLARIIDHQKSEKTTLLAGTLGYMAPEMQLTGRASKETDVYAFGILLLEVVCGRRPLEVQGFKQEEYVLLDVVWRAHEAGNLLKVVDSRLSKSGMRKHLEPGAFEEDMMIGRVLHVGLLCCLPNPSERPSMRVVNKWFQSREVGVIGLPPLPVTRPHDAQFPVFHSSELGTETSNSSHFTHRSSRTTTSS
ncbi:hypothetical protein M758_3G076500 [Ceratodon purpureus]|uniref:Protein kinase domain-containing protein n=1 Tax=Ceratodon purpureus TaxID=3225 RepID=A0A8T0IFV6_CERPU|nr:hypothetical protein KC19_3G075500 [Ceratodon purpureus]KAG0622165.1 hypothetical protein M758_3G076500 [Ceratodon purpureus]